MKTKNKKTAAAPAAAPAITFTLPANVPVGSTHYMIRRPTVEFVSDLKHCEADVVAFGGLRADTELLFGNCDAAGNFTVRGADGRVTVESKPQGARTTGGTGKTAFLDGLLIEGTHTSRSIAEQIVAKFGGDLQKTLVIVRSRPWHLHKKGLTAGYVHAAKGKAAATPTKAKGGKAGDKTAKGKKPGKVAKVTGIADAAKSVAQAIAAAATTDVSEIAKLEAQGMTTSDAQGVLLAKQLGKARKGKRAA